MPFQTHTRHLMTLRRSMKNSQKGLSIISLFVIIAILGAVFLVGMQSVPAWSEYMSIKKAVKQLEDSGVSDPSEIRKKWDERATLEYITTLTGRDLQIVKTGKGVKINFEYEKRIPLVANAFLVYEFSSEGP